MDLQLLLRDVIKPELNHIYTEPPSQRGGGQDMGLFCREHAYHCFFLCKLLGYDSSIKRGELSFAFDDSLMYTTLDSGSDHAWCQANSVLPVDLSVNFQFYNVKSNIGLIYGTGQQWAYSVSYTADASEYDRCFEDRTASPRIAYLERETVGIAAGELVDDPHRFLIKPPGAGGMVALFGKHVFSSINLHLLDLAHGKTKRLTTYKD